MTTDSGVFAFQNLMNELAPNGQEAAGPASLLYHAVGPVGWIIFAVFVILSPTIAREYIWPRLFPHIVPWYVKFFAFIDEFEPADHKIPGIQSKEIQEKLIEEIRRNPK